MLLDVSLNLTGVGVDIQVTINATINYLCNRYTRSRFSSTEDDWPPYQPKHYTTLALIHNRGKYPDAAVITVTQELAAAGNIANNSIPTDNERYSRATKNISEIFAPIDECTVDSTIILIEGAPGIGKTVLTKEIAFLWAKNKLLITKDLLFLLFLRE